jgi:hypothetical protein
MAERCSCPVFIINFQECLCKMAHLPHEGDYL